jgi:copper oxidase (laccase) domain-containing protein
MVPKKQVSPAIRILRGERDASARATHLEAATRKFLVTTNERKQMSTKTNFKRIALVAVAALGLGVLSSVPSQAIGNADLLTLVKGSQYTLAAGGGTIADSGTAATATFSYIAAASTNDTYTLTISLKSSPTGSSALPFLMVDTYSVGSTTGVIGVVDTDALIGTGAGSALVQYDTAAASNGTVYVQNPGATAGVITAKFKVMIASPTVAGSYVVNIKGGPTSAHATVGGSDNIVADGQDVTITVSGSDAVPVSGLSKAQLTLGATYAGNTGAAGADSAVAVAMTASTTARAVLRVVLANAAGSATYASESVTITTTVGSVGLLSVGSVGRSATFLYTPGATGTDFGIYSDGTAGTATITISTPSTTYATKSVTFYSTTVGKIVATKALNTLGLGSNATAVLGKATDTNGNTVGSATAVYAYSSNTAVVSDSGTACTYDTTYQIHKCDLTGVAAGTAKITLRNSGTAGAAATVSSAEAIEVTVNASAPATLTMKWNKETYAPGEKGYLIVSALDSTGKAVGPQTLSAMINASGMSVSGSFSGTQTIPNTTTSYDLATKNALIGSSVTTTDAAATITVYMPYSGGTVSVSATAGTSFPAAAQATKVTATASVTDSGAAALAAVTALATTVASLKTLITTLTNLVLKIQKKVKA